MQQINEIIEALSQNLSEEYSQDFLNKQIEKINEKVANIETNGYKLNNYQTISLRNMPYYVGSHGYFDENAISQFDGVEYNVFTFTNEAGQNRYCIFNNQLQLLNISLSKLKSRDEYVTTTQEYQTYINLKENFIPFLEKKGISMDAKTAYVLFNYSIQDTTPEELANNFVNDINYAINNISIIEAQESITETTKPGVIKKHYDLKHEMLDCGQDRQFFATRTITPLINNFYNSGEMNFITQSVYDAMKDLALKKFKENDFYPTIEVADFLNLKDDVLNDIIKNKDAEALNKFLVKEICVLNENNEIILENKPWPISLVSALSKEILKDDNTIQPEKINLNLTKMLTEIRLLNPELTDNKLITKALVNYLKTDSSIHNLITAYSQPDFIENIKQGKTVTEILDEYDENTNLYTLQEAFIRQKLIKLGFEDEKALRQLSSFIQYDNTGMNRIKACIKTQEDIDNLSALFNSEFNNYQDLYNKTFIYQDIYEKDMPIDVVDKLLKYYSTEFDTKQFKEIAYGIINDVNVDLYAFEDFNADKMKEMRLQLEQSLPTEIVNMIVNTNTTQLYDTLSHFDTNIRKTFDTYGGHGPGDFDTRGGYQATSVCGTEIMFRTLSSSFEGGYETDARLWAHNYSTHFDSEQMDADLDFCKEHKLALSIALLNDKLPDKANVKITKEQIQIIENTLKYTYNVDPVKEENIEKICQALKDGKEMGAILMSISSIDSLDNLINNKSNETEIEKNNQNIQVVNEENNYDTI